MSAAFEFTLNGQILRPENVSPNTTLLEFLRASGRTGTKEGCAEGDCGACSVAMVDRNAEGKTVYRAINSCIIPVCLLAGREVISVEGVACEKKPHPVQQKLVECHGSQCGYCTPGFIISLFEGYYRDDINTSDKLDDQLCGNLCRCTGYRPIRDAANEAFAEKQSRGEDPFSQRLQAAAALPAVEFEAVGEKFQRPQSITELLRILREIPNARLIAGATELGLEITKRFKKFPVLVSVEGVEELRAITNDEAEWRIGAAATLTQIEEKVAPEFPMLAEMLRVFGSRQIRNRATMGGNIVTASPIGDSAPVLLALNAKVILISEERERVLAITEFFVSYRKTALQPGEILKAIVIPRPATANDRRHFGRWFKVSKRRDMDISTAAGCFALGLDASGIIQSARVAYGGVAATPVRASRTEAVLLGKAWNEETLSEALATVREEFTPISDVRGSAGYRRELIGSLLEKFYHETTVPFIPDAQIVNQSRLTSAPMKALPHESAHKHVNGEAVYTDDTGARRGMLEVWPVCAPHARAKILKRDTSGPKGMPGIAAVLLAEDVPGMNDVGAVRHDEILLADKEVFFHGQIIALVVGETQEVCRAAAAKIIVEYEPLAPILKIEEAMAQNSFHTDTNFIRRGEMVSAFAAATHTIDGEFSFGGQEHFYLEMQSACAEPGEDGSMFVISSTQHPSEVQHIVAHLLHVPVNQVVVQSPRMGGGFGGKETQAATFAALASLAAAKTGRAVRVRMNRDLDMMLTGKRHPFLARYKVGFDEKGQLLAAKIELFSNGGWSLDLSMPVTDRAMFHLDNAYYIPNVEFSGRVAKTNLASNTAFRGFGGPQGMLVIEEIVDRIARHLGVAPEIIRERNLYRGTGETNTTHYGQEMEDNRIQRVWQELKLGSQFDKRRVEMATWNAAHPHSKRGLAMTPVKFGISFTLTHLNQAGALVLIYQDGTVQVNHGGTEMGQGIHTNIAMVAATALGLNVDHIRVMTTSTEKVPNTSATAASCGTDLNGMAVKNACETLRERLVPVAAKLLAEKLKRDVLPQDVGFGAGFVFARVQPEETTTATHAARDRCNEEPKRDDQITFCEVVTQAYLQRISLSATGFYRTPEIHYDRAKGKGKPFHYFAVGAAVTEVEVDGFTGMTRVLRTDILHDVGDSINPGINRGQIEGGFVQGMGWLTCEELIWDDKGRLLTHSPDTYKIPAIGDAPMEFNVSFLSEAAQPNTIHGSKAVGEPPLMLAISVREAIRDAVAAFCPRRSQVNLASPATGEAIFSAIWKEQRRVAHASQSTGQQC
jgi:xanthine dehydrogenase molybdopterin binding subunit/xanthine dehydrogenase small subunit